MSRDKILGYLFPFEEYRSPVLGTGRDTETSFVKLKSPYKIFGLIGLTLCWWLLLPFVCAFAAIRWIIRSIPQWVEVVKLASPAYRRRREALRASTPLDELQDVVFYRPKVDKDGRLIEHWALIERGYPRGPYIDWTEDEKRWLDRILVEQRRMYAAHRERERVRALKGEAYVQDFIFAPWALEGMSRPPDMDYVLEWMARENARTNEADEERLE